MLQTTGGSLTVQMQQAFSAEAVRRHIRRSPANDRLFLCRFAYTVVSGRIKSVSERGKRCRRPRPGLHGCLEDPEAPAAYASATTFGTVRKSAWQTSLDSQNTGWHFSGSKECRQAGSSGS